MSKPAISVLMPIRNSATYLEVAISSVKKQTLTDFEFIIVNDGSTDGSSDIAREHAAQDKRITVHDRPHVGLTRSLNWAIPHCQGRYIARFDSDDLCHPCRLSLQARYLDNNPSAVAVGCQCKGINARGDVIGIIETPIGHDAIKRQFLDGGGGILHPAAMIRTDVLKDVGGYDESLPYAQDLDLFLRLAQLGRLANLPEVGLYYRIHANQIGQAKRLEQLNCVISILHRHRNTGGAKSSNRAIATLYQELSWRQRKAGHRTKSISAAVKSLINAPRQIRSWRGMIAALVDLR